jgi:hypothetical protein
MKDAITLEEAQALLDCARHLRDAFRRLDIFVEQNGLGGDPFFCDGYPFGSSFDEVDYAVAEWVGGMADKVAALREARRP